MLMLVAVPPALAKPGRNEAASAEMRAAFEEANADYNLGHFEAALAAFERGYRVKSDPAFLFNIGQCQRQLDRPRDAGRSYRAYLRESPSVAPAQRTEVERLIGLMDEAVARANSNVPPTGVSPPAEPAPAPAVAVVAPPPNLLVQTPPPPPPRRRTALWIGLGVGAGVVVAALAIGLGVGLSQSGGAPGASLGNMTVSLK
jgi:tetratricopeptide (TPR) repeat protein